MINKISFVIIVKNEERNIEGLLKQAKIISDEIIIVDSGSSDRTIEIVNKYTSKIFYLHNYKYLSEIRNYAIKQAKYDWILTIDADERLSDKFIKNIRQYLNTTEIKGYWFKRRLYVSKNRYLKYGLFYPDYQLRLFRNQKTIKYFGGVHEKLSIPESDTRKLPLEIYHFQNPLKVGSFKNMYLLVPFIKTEGSYYATKNKTIFWLLIKGVTTFLNMFFGGLIRGKGILDGFIGIKANLIFSLSILASYLYAIKIKLSKI